MSRFFICEIEELKKQGVEVIKTEKEYRKNGEGHTTIEVTRELDFSEHDKVFENEIAGLKAKIAIKDMDYKTASELLGKYQRENEALKKRIDELEKELSSVVKEAERKEFIREMSCLEIQELKQRISELESKEMENFSEIDTSNPLACAESLIEHMTHCEKFMIMPERDVQTFSVEELKEIADYLMVYYKHHKDRDAEDTISF